MALDLHIFLHYCFNLYKTFKKEQLKLFVLIEVCMLESVVKNPTLKFLLPMGIFFTCAECNPFVSSRDVLINPTE